MQERPSHEASISAWYAAPLSEFIGTSTNEIVGALSRRGAFDDLKSQRDAWVREIGLLREAVAGLDGWVALEFEVPRLGSRIDAVVISGAAVVPIEFKVGEQEFTASARNQAWDYALDLKNFHEASHDARISPILVATEAAGSESDWAAAAPDHVCPPRNCAPADLGAALRDAVGNSPGSKIDARAWLSAPYHPSPSIIEAARALYARHTVEAISRSDAGAKNLAVTSRTIEAIIQAAQLERFKAIVFVTGVPGAGKTLVGLNVATRRREEENAKHSVFLSGNGPLVAVLREALTRDELARRRSQGKKIRKGDVGQEVKPFIQNVHHFRDEGVRTLPANSAPLDHVVIFDEAQRAWDIGKTERFMKQRKGLPSFGRSEPQFLIEYMDRHHDWAVVICLVGGGQEIHDGEAGISTWLDAVRRHFPSWRAYISPELSDSEYDAGHALQSLAGVSTIVRDPALHLSTSMRSFRSERVSSFVKAVLDVEVTAARELLNGLLGRYPIALTRDIDVAKEWTRRQARGSERFGLVASSSALRLKPHAVDVRVDIDPVQWFLNDSDDTRSSYYLEDAATEYQIQGLELDWVCVTWDADLRHHAGAWDLRSFNARGWLCVKKAERRRYLVNAYRVLLTRARQGMVLFVPRGDSRDPTRAPEFYDGTYRYLRDIGIPSLDMGSA